jgi:hypothetical protein
MPFTISELEALRKKLDRDRRELEERERALAKVEEMLREEIAASAPSLPSPGPMPEPGGFSEAVNIAVSALAGQEFNVQDVEEYLQTQGFPLPKAEPRSRIAMVLQKLYERGTISRTFEGKGRAPHRYQLRRTVSG